MASKLRSHNEWFMSVIRGGRKSCSGCGAKLEPGESIWCWGEYVRAKWNSIKDCCKTCWPRVRKRLTDHTDQCGCTVSLCARSGYGPLPEWLTLEVREECLV
jgi:hypothetical protein